MKPFLQQLVETVKTEHQNIGEVTIIVPTQRSGVYIKKYLSESATETTWLPEIVTIDDFIKKNCKLKSIDSVELLFLFYELYLELEKEKADSFLHFSKWAPTLLADFNEMDHYMVDAKIIFNDLKNIKDIDSWSFNEEKLTNLQSNFSSFWAKLPDFYNKLNDKLTELEKGYSGKLYKWVATSIYEVLDDYEPKTVYFAGFNALSTSEEQIIETFVNSGKGQLFIDADTFYVDNVEHEAGYFIRKQIAKNGKSNINWIESNILNSAKKITLLSAQSDVMMAKSVGEIIENLSEEEIKKTAVVLADENLLLPVLNSIPNKIDTYNISLGYSLYNSPIYSLLNSVFTVQESYIKFNKGSIHYRGFLSIVEHYLMKNILNSYKVKQEIVTKNITFVSNKFIQTQDELSPVFFLFEKWDETNLLSQAFDSLKRLIDLIVQSISFQGNAMELEYLFSAKKLIQKVENKLTKTNYIQDIKTLKFLFFQLFKSESVAFIGEPLSGLQIIGMLETRALDFENVILVSVNEGVLPKGNTANSFFPYELKRLYELPTYKEKEAIYANHFYRLMQRTSKAFLLYNNSTSGMGATEKSRYIEQLKEELKDQKQIEISEKIISLDIVNNKVDYNTVSKSDKVIESLKNLAEYGLSPSALNKYIQCPLDFYYSYVVGLKQEEDVEETIEASTFGNVIHKVLENLYEPLLNRVLIPEEIQQLKKNLDQELENQFKEIYSSHYDTGKNYLFFHAAKKNILDFLTQEEKLVKDNEVIVIGLEKKVEKAFPIELNGTIIQAKLKGTIDRIDRVNGELRVIDYKTGVVNANELELKDLDKIISDPNKSKAFQLLFYGLLMEDSLAENEQFTSGIISFKRLNNGLLELLFAEGRAANKTTWHPTKIEREEFIGKLQELIQTIFDTSLTFEHNEKAKYCDYC
ncbi:MAG: PD-(D/E)XK nuclease family protein [Flavobacteriales bacterium]